jgi:hypothetical protein
MNYNFPYYKELFENYGFQIYFEQLCFTRPILQKFRGFSPLPMKEQKKSSYFCTTHEKNNLEKFAKDFTEIYNKAWAAHGEGKQLEEAKVLKMFNKMKPIINEHISWFVYENEKPIAMWINLPT